MQACVTPSNKLNFSKTLLTALSAQCLHHDRRKRVRSKDEEAGVLPSPKRPALTQPEPEQLNSGQVDEGKEFQFLSDSYLFENTQEDLHGHPSLANEEENQKEENKGRPEEEENNEENKEGPEEEENNEENKEGPGEEDQKELFGDYLHHFYQLKDKRKVRFLTIRFTISMLYIALLYTNHNLLLCDFTR